jgi:hypothetical protein
MTTDALRRVRKEKNGCWTWLGYCDPRGYGQVKHEGRTLYAHQAFYIVLVGPVPKGKELDHLCKNPPCVNPKHLEPVTHRENQRRGDSWVGKNARKTHCPKRHPYSKKNTYINPLGARVCRACAGARNRAYLSSLVVRP